MMGRRKVEQAVLLYEFSLEKHVPANHPLRASDRFVELGELRRALAAFYSTMGRPSIDPELMIRMLVIGYCFGIRSERRLCEEAHLNISLASLGGHSLSTPVSAFALSATCARHSACFVGPQVRHDQELYRAVVLLYGRDTGRRNEGRRLNEFTGRRRAAGVRFFPHSRSKTPRQLAASWPIRGTGAGAGTIADVEALD